MTYSTAIKNLFLGINGRLDRPIFCFATLFIALTIINSKILLSFMLSSTVALICFIWFLFLSSARYADLPNQAYRKTPYQSYELERDLYLLSDYLWIIYKIQDIIAAIFKIFSIGSLDDENNPKNDESYKVTLFTIFMLCLIQLTITIYII